VDSWLSHCYTYYIAVIYQYRLNARSFPLSGTPLVFVSQGGTALLIALAEVGILLNISRYQKYENSLCRRGTAGHFYPIIAVAEEVNRVSKEERLVPPELYYMAPSPYDERALFENNILYRHVSAGKIRRYFSLLNVSDLFKTAFE